MLAVVVVFIGLLVILNSVAGGIFTYTIKSFPSPFPIDNDPTIADSADFGSYDPLTGVITIKLATSKADDTPLGPGSNLSGLNVRTYLARPDAGQKSQNNASDITSDGSYALVGNGSCFCAVDQPPIAGLSASPKTGPAPLTVHFDASSSVDPDAEDAIGSYIFDFGDGSAPVTQTGPLATHTYTAASGAGGYTATLVVHDLKCDTPSANLASEVISISGTTAVESGEDRPRVFRITPQHNPAHGGATFALDMIRDGVVNVQLFDADGRRVAEVANSWMPAGRHDLEWGATGRSGKALPPGVYLVRAKWGGHQALSRLVLVH